MSSASPPTAGSRRPAGAVGRSAWVVPLLAAFVIAALALNGLFLPACAFAALVLILSRISLGALDVRVLVWMLAGVVFLIPDRFAIGASLPIDLEPYRVLFGFVVLIWVVVLLTNPEAQFRRSLLDLPLS